MRPHLLRRMLNVGSRCRRPRLSGLLPLLILAQSAVLGAEFPGPQAQLASFLPYQQLRIAGEPVVTWLDHHRVMLLNQARETAPGVVAGGCGYACATPLTADGYLLTARHAALPPILLIRAGHGTPVMTPARLVWQGEAGCDLALIKAAWQDEEATPWSEERSLDGGTVLLAAGTTMAEDALHQWFVPEHSAGRLVQAQEQAHAGGHAACTALTVRIPAHPGDSGGPVVTTDGHLAGILTAHLLLRNGTSSGDSLVLRPDLQELTRLIDEDRARQAPHPVGAQALATMVRVR